MSNFQINSDKITKILEKRSIKCKTEYLVKIGTQNIW